MSTQTVITGDESQDETLNEILNFDKIVNNVDNDGKLSDVLERYINSIGQSSDIQYPWHQIKNILRKKMELVIKEFMEKYPLEEMPKSPHDSRQFSVYEMKEEILQRFSGFNGAPFTIQRICELLSSPYKYHKRVDKFLRGLECNVRVVSTIDSNESKESVGFGESLRNEVRSLCAPNSTFTPPSSSPSSSSSSTLTFNPQQQSLASSSSSSSTSSSQSPASFSDQHEENDLKRDPVPAKAAKLSEDNQSSVTNSINPLISSPSSMVTEMPLKESTAINQVLENDITEQDRQQASTSNDFNKDKMISDDCEGEKKTDVDDALMADKCEDEKMDDSPSEIAPLTQLDSFAAVFAPPSLTPLDIVSDMKDYENENNMLTSDSDSLSSPSDSSNELSSSDCSPELQSANTSMDIQDVINEKIEQTEKTVTTGRIDHPTEQQQSNGPNIENQLS